MPQEAIGWFSSAVLLVTLIRQVYKQWKAGTSEGVSKWLYLGEIVANGGFLVYSWLIRNWVFLVTNALILVSSLVGLGIVLRHRRAAAVEKRRAA